MSEVNLVTYPDFDHNSDYKICLVADTPSAVELLDIIERFKGRVSIHCITHDVTDFDWIATTNLRAARLASNLEVLVLVDLVEPLRLHDQDRSVPWNPAACVMNTVRHTVCNTQCVTQ